MSFKKFLSSRVFIKQLVLAVVVFIVLIVLTLQGLKIYTHHGESFPIPDFAGLTRQEAFDLAKQQKLKLEILDSVYVKDKAPGVVVDQVPESGFRVKQKHTVFITVNSILPEQVILPKLTDITFRQAQILIENSGLQVGQIYYEPSEYNNLVLKAQIDSVNLKPGIKLDRGTSIDLIIGRTAGNTATPLPDLIGLTLQEAQKSLTYAMLNRGVLIYDKTVTTSEDSINAMVWQQNPTPALTKTVNLGTSVDLWLTVDEQKIKRDTLDTETGIGLPSENF